MRALIVGRRQHLDHPRISSRVLAPDMPVPQADELPA
jgi:hypothetical protein